MKKWIRSVSQAAVLGMALGTYTQIAHADSGTPSRVSGDVRPPATLIELDQAQDILEALYLRMHTVNIQNHISEMKRDGVTTREYVAAFDIQGALVYDHELAGLGLKPENLRPGRNTGLQILPYEVQVGTDGRVFVKASPVAFRNMTSALLNCEEYGDRHGLYCDGIRYGEGRIYEGYDVFKVLNNVDYFTFEYNKDVVNEVSTYSLDFINIDLNASLFASASGNFFIALTAGGTFGIDWMEMNDFNPEGSALEGVSELDSSYVALKGKYGLVAHYDSGFWRMNAGVNFIHDVQVNTINDDKISKLEEPEKSFTRYQYIARPFIEGSVQLQSSEDGLPIRAGLRVDGTINMTDKISDGTAHQDLRGRGNESLVNGALFISW